MSLPCSSSNWHVYCRWTYFLRTAFQFDCPGQQLGTLDKSNVFKPELSPLVTNNPRPSAPKKYRKVTKSTNPIKAIPKKKKVWIFILLDNLFSKFLPVHCFEEL